MAQWTTRTVFALTIFLGSFLLFVSEPIQGKILLPLLGGAPSVWNTCLLFFQGMLLLSYLYAHLIATKLSIKHQAILHSVVLLLPLALLPVRVPQSLLASEWMQNAPVSWLLLVLSVTVGPAFFAIATTSPLMQSWFVRIGAKQNPYPLYAASNAGSLLALLCYPFVIEPELATSTQTQIWAGLYAGLAALCAVIGWRVSRRAPLGVTETTDAVTVQNAEGSHEFALTMTPADHAILIEKEPEDLEGWNRGLHAGTWPVWRERLMWIILAAVPSSLMLGVTSFLTTDIASIPLLWILPLALYTLSFVIVFARYDERSSTMMGRFVPLATAALLFLIFTEFRAHLWIIITAHLSSFFILATACHGRLALSRPAPAKLTSFYCFMALGGVLGGAFNTLVAPEIFTRIAEYPLGVVLAFGCFAVFTPGPKLRRAQRQWTLVAALAGAACMLAMLKLYALGSFTPISLYFEDTLPADAVQSAIVYGAPALMILILALTVRRRFPAAAASALGFVLVAYFFDLYSNTLYQSRNFFGVLSVRAYEEGKTHTLVHGGILHGEQWQQSLEDRAEPRSYYHREGPLGQIMATLDEHVTYPRIAAIGLGAGAIAAYGHKDNAITFYELNPAVEALARNPTLFTYVDDCLRRWCNLNVVLGDGRLKISEAEDSYDLIIVDAFSSDAIPIHLVTLEAMKIYLSHITSRGLVAFHISNRYVDLEPVLLNLANAMNLGYAIRKDEGDDTIGKGASTWVLLAAKEGLYEKIAVNDQRWTGLEPKAGVGLWRDDFANVARAFVWN